MQEAVETLLRSSFKNCTTRQSNEVGEASAAIFEVHQMMLEDEDYQDAIRNMIRT